MRRRRLIGMYRVLLKSMNLVCCGRPSDYDPRRSCREGQERETEREPGLESNLSDWSTQHNRSGPPGPSFTPLGCGFEAVVLTIRPSYLGAREGSRNEAAVAISAENRNPRS